ncbi:MAG: VCBS repeat-containing protein, partial [Candidatus Glassbacteria bacterium]|nr:VCBS repeat-containing protein [Candidatus Glassbacteria bacterium]
MRSNDLLKFLSCCCLLCCTVLAASPAGRGEALPLESAGGFGPVNNGFLGYLTLGDWNGDGWNDLIVFSIGYNGGLYLYRCIPGGDVPRFERRERIDGGYGLPALGADDVFWWSARPIGPSWWLDADDDGLPDLVSRTGDGLVAFPNRGMPGRPEFAAPEKLPVEGEVGCFADLDGDGILDIIQAEWLTSGYWPPFDLQAMTPDSAGEVYPGRWSDGQWLGDLGENR